MSSQRIPDISRGTFLCHAHLAGNVNNPAVAVCMIRHRDMDTAWDCASRARKEDPFGTRYIWTTCRPQFCSEALARKAA